MEPLIPPITDIAVVGGGIVCASIAWHLAARNIAVTVFERGTIASGASGRTGALLRQHYSNRPEATLAHESLKVFRDWPEIVGGAPVHHPTGLVLTLAAGPHADANVARLRRNVAMQNGVGIASEAITPDRLRDLQPFVRVDDLAAAAYEPTSGYADAVAATRGMARAAARAGARIVEGCPVLALTAQGDRVTGVVTPSGPVRAGVVVCAAGPWSTALLGAIGVSLPVAALRVQIAILHRPLAFDAPHFVYLDTAAGMFCRPYGPGCSLVGVSGGDQHDHVPVDPDRYEQRVDAEYPGRAISAIARRIPGMTGAAFLNGRAGLYDMTPDAHPIIGPGPLDGLYLACGFSGAGFKKGPAVGRLMADTIVDNRCDWLDPSPFRLDRFQADGWQRPWSENEYVFETDFGHGF